MSYLALNLFNLTLKRYNIIYPSAFENLVIQTSILGNVSAKHPSKHCSFRQDPMRLPLIPKSQWKCRNLFSYSTSVKEGIANGKNRWNWCLPGVAPLTKKPEDISRRLSPRLRADNGSRENEKEGLRLQGANLYLHFPEVLARCYTLYEELIWTSNTFKQLTTNQTKKKGVQWLNPSMLAINKRSS